MVWLTDDPTNPSFNFNLQANSLIIQILKICLIELGILAHPGVVFRPLCVGPTLGEVFGAAEDVGP